MPMGAPGCPEFAFAVMSTAKVRIVLTHFQSRSVYEEDFAMVETYRRKWKKSVRWRIDLWPLPSCLCYLCERLGWKTIEEVQR